MIVIVLAVVHRVRVRLQSRKQNGSHRVPAHHHQRHHLRHHRRRRHRGVHPARMFLFEIRSIFPIIMCRFRCFQTS